MARTAEGGVDTLSDRRYGLALLSLILVFVVAAWWQYSPALFGAAHDDTLYLSLAKAIAEGTTGGFPSLPLALEKTKYPPLYPWLLSLVWRVEPDFPQNVAWAWALNLLFGAGLLVAAVASLRSLGCSRREALLLGGLFALSPRTILWTNLILSDVLAALLMLLGILAADRAFRDGSSSFWTWWSIAVALSAVSISARTLSITLVGGLVFYALSRRKYLGAAAASLPALPIVIGVLRSASVVSAEIDGGMNGFRQNVIYYTDYIAFWKLSVPNVDVLWAQLQFNLLELLKFPAASVFMFDAEMSDGMIMQAAAVAVSTAVLVGVVGRARERGLSAIHWVCLCSLPVLLLWNFPLYSRFCLPFVPLLLAGGSLEVRRLIGTIRKAFAERATDQRFAAGLIGVVAVSLLVHGAWRYAVVLPLGNRSVGRERVTTLDAKKQAYAWLARQQDANPVISCEDALLYLYSGRRAIRPIMPSTEAFYMQDREALNRELIGLGDTAEAVQAGYWMVAVDDFHFDYAKDELIVATQELLAGSHVVFESDDQSVRLYGLSASRDVVVK